ncbi:hypothetical protein CEXT_629761 [Caerostris extrusa]|uniref:Uncharacterized protein n=1 Tax=Caerostris extrusa TaxID=172846 RepID=A0AAV4NZA5_CAEEX|nr:hypothetical protein CEXT_629761 [Caerostris extrusa]
MDFERFLFLNLKIYSLLAKVRPGASRLIGRLNGNLVLGKCPDTPCNPTEVQPLRSLKREFTVFHNPTLFLTHYNTSRQSVS